jgi:hypothetical protein
MALNGMLLERPTALRFLELRLPPGIPMFMGWEDPRVLTLVEF